MAFAFAAVAIVLFVGLSSFGIWDPWELVPAVCFGAGAGLVLGLLLVVTIAAIPLTLMAGGGS